MEKGSWLRRNFLPIVVTVWVFFGAGVAYALLPAFSGSVMSKFPAMVWVGTAFGCVGFRLAIVIERRTHRKPKNP